MAKPFAEEPAPAPAPLSMRDQLKAAFAARDAAAQAFVPDPAAVAAADLEVQRLVHAWSPEEEFDPQAQPVLAKLTEMAKSRNPLAVRLLLQERYGVKLHQNAPNEPQKPDEEIGLNGLLCTIPRGRKILLPASYHEILESSEVT